MARIRGLADSIGTSPTPERSGRFETFEFISSFNSHDPTKSNEKAWDGCIPESFVGNSSRQIGLGQAHPG